MRDKNHVYLCIRCPLSIYVSLQKYNIMEHTCIHWVEMFIPSLHRCFVYGWSIWVEQTLENTEGTNRQSREIGNTRRRNTKQKHNALCVGHHYAKTNTNNVNKTWTLIQTTGGNDVRSYHMTVLCHLLFYYFQIAYLQLSFMI